MKKNVSDSADAEFVALLEHEDPVRYERLMKNIRRDNPGMSMAEEAALTNFMLGLPTGQFRFAIVTGPVVRPNPVLPARDPVIDRRNLRKRIRQAKTMRRSSGTEKSVAVGNTI